MTTAGCALATIYLSLHIITIPFQLDFAEGDILNAGARITQGLTPYPDPTQWPVILNPYGPVPYLCVALAIKIAGVSFTASRAFNIVSVVGVMLTLGGLIYHATRHRAVSLIFPAVFLFLPPAHDWLPLLRVDFLALLLSLVGIHTFLTRRRFWYLSNIFFVLAFFTKVTALAAPTACVGWLFHRQEWKKSVQMITSGLFLAALLFSALQVWTDGHFFFHQFQTHPDAYSVLDFLEALRGMIKVLGMPAVLTCIAFWRAVRTREFSLLHAYIPLALMTAFTAGKSGASSNHLIEPAAALCLGGALGWNMLVVTCRSRPTLNFALAVGAAVMAGAFIYEYHRFAPYDTRSGDCGSVYDFVRHTTGNRILAEDDAAVLLAGKEIQVSDQFIYVQLLQRGGWSDAVLLDKIRSHSFDLILADFADQDRWTLPLIRAIRANYTPVRQFHCTEAAVAFEPIRPAVER